MPSFLKPRARSPRAQALAGPLLLMPLLLAGAARADIVALFGSGTEVRTVGTTREISAGVKRGSNQFFRLSEFNTRTEGISDVQFKDVQFKNDLVNVIVGVTSKSEINKPVGLALKGNLYFLSPLGIRIERGAAFNNVNTLLLTTSSKLALGDDIFDVYAKDDALNLQNKRNGYSKSPETTLAGLLEINLKEGATEDVQFFGNPDPVDPSNTSKWQAESFDQSFGIQIAEGSSLTVDKSLLLVTHKAPITISSASLTARGETPGNPNAFKSDAFGQGDGLAIVTQNLTITGSPTQRSAFTSNTEILIREPLPPIEPIDNPGNPGVGSLASKLYSEAKIQKNDADFYGTVSWLQITSLDLFAGEKVPEDSTWKVLLRSYGLMCNGIDCGKIEPVDTDNRKLERIRAGRKSEQGDAIYEPNTDLSSDFVAKRIGRTLYAGIDLIDTRIISGYGYAEANQSSFNTAKPAKIEFGFDPASADFDRIGGGRLEGLQFYAQNVDQIARVDLGNSFENRQGGSKAYDAKKDFPSQGPAGKTFLNNQEYAKKLGPGETPDLGMYWFFDNDGGANNSIRSITTSLPMAVNTIDPPRPPVVGPIEPPRPPEVVINRKDNSQVSRPDLRPTQNTYIFDNTLFVIDQNVSEDYESASSASSSKSALLTVNLAPARSVPKGRCGSGSNQAECKPVSKP